MHGSLPISFAFFPFRTAFQQMKIDYSGKLTIYLILIWLIQIVTINDKPPICRITDVTFCHNPIFFKTCFKQIMSKLLFFTTSHILSFAVAIQIGYYALHNFLALPDSFMFPFPLLWAIPPYATLRSKHPECILRRASYSHLVTLHATI